jgi:hypothetical protein
VQLTTGREAIPAEQIQVVEGMNKCKKQHFIIFITLRLSLDFCLLAPPFKQD